MKFLTRPVRGGRSGRRKLLDVCFAALVITGAALLVARIERFAGADLSGQVRVVDGDSLVLGDRRLRLKGIDAPELRQRCRKQGFDYGCGTEAASHLRGLIGRHDVACRSEGRDRYGRDLVRCIANEVDLNAAMVRSGHAVAFGDYNLDEAQARQQGAGLWAGEFDPPKQWRAIHGGVQEELHAGLTMLTAFLRRLFGV
ncbi:thermonuclease family protein [Hoeflea sp. YIM 152468]|uniref:thermonuclease family protein n=1 Tax=Hoeflea sp. YIM 152468 TaxID=3031759 RepID=UPI0023DB6596|nr:thermonuclease family protein [Hoeflea sp. YIM 152468]MDF1609512.1 thermonuclease family protein [Hoeflea sp. YIM 152468]